MKQVAGSIKLELAQFREMEAFAQFGSDLDASTQKLLARGARLTELLKQAQFKPYPVELQVAIIFAGVKGYLDNIPVKDVKRFEEELVRDLQINHSDILEKIKKDEKVSEETESKLRTLLEKSAKVFV